MNRNHETDYFSFFEIGIIHKSFLPIITLLVPTIGLFFNNRTGWFLMMSYFYFAVTSFVYSLVESEFGVQMTLYLLLGGIVLLVPSLFIMNVETIHRRTYKIPRSKLFLFNVVTLITGVSIVLLALIWNHWVAF